MTNEDFFQVFGHITVFFATWDFFVSMLISRLLRMDRRMPGSNSTLGQKLTYLERLNGNDTVKPELLILVKAALPCAIEISKKRNRFIHDQWVFAPEKISRGVIERLPPKFVDGPHGRTIDCQPETYSLQQLYDFLALVGKQQEVFNDFLNQLPQVETS